MNPDAVGALILAAERLASMGLHHAAIVHLVSIASRAARAAADGDEKRYEAALQRARNVLSANNLILAVEGGPVAVRPNGQFAIGPEDAFFVPFDALGELPDVALVPPGRVK